MINIFEYLLDIAIFAKNKKTYKELILFTIENNISDKTIKLALENKVLIPFYEYPKNRGYLKNKYFLELLLAHSENFSLEKEHIIIVGCGAIENFMTYPLSTLGLGAITFIDEDKIEESNLNRQFLFSYSYNDIGSDKVNIIKEKIKSLNKTIQTRSYKEKVSAKLLENIFTSSKIKPSLILLSVDDDYCLSLVNKFCIENSIPLINIGYLNDFSVIGSFYIPNI
ncbi:ThiF family adenylyltransferase [Borreliella turdi]|uniref:ThiF family adenylyltransferase n=1 Tax=Borreliella turdi TaxID=57863 RepID=UPI001F22B0AC|nr:ThiF family adenylyltransferase [Borreliella turdi]